ncbi:MAG: hypothetical protein PHD43_19730 [Methylococcales bacterium]|nr:hypothetical protein [Methylococcales bacterium]
MKEFSRYLWYKISYYSIDIEKKNGARKMKSKVWIQLGVSLCGYIIVIIVMVYASSSVGHGPTAAELFALFFIPFFFLLCLLCLGISKSTSVIYWVALFLPLIIIVFSPVIIPVVTSVRETILYQFFPKGWNSSSEVDISNVTTEIKRAETGQPLTVIVKYEVTVKNNWKVSVVPRLNWTSLHKKMNWTGVHPWELRLIEAKVTPEPVNLLSEIPHIRSSFNFRLKEGKTYLQYLEFAPSFINGFIDPYSKPPQKTASACFISDRSTHNLAERKKTINALQESKNPKYILTISIVEPMCDSPMCASNKDSFTKVVEIIPLGAFYKGYKEIGTPECIS